MTFYSIKRKFFTNPKKQSFGNVEYPKLKQNDAEDYIEDKFLCSTFTAFILCTAIPRIHDWFVDHDIDYRFVNVTDITVMAKAAEAGGADAISLINTITGMKIDINKRAFAVANKTGGLSGPAIKPVAVRMVYQVAQAVSVPVIGMGGITTGEDAIEFMMAGATAVSVGTANFRNPCATIDILAGMKAFMEKNNIANINEIIGCVK